MLGKSCNTTSRTGSRGLTQPPPPREMGVDQVSRFTRIHAMRRFPEKGYPPEGWGISYALRNILHATQTHIWYINENHHERAQH